MKIVKMRLIGPFRLFQQTLECRTLQYVCMDIIETKVHSTRCVHYLMVACKKNIPWYVSTDLKRPHDRSSENQNGKFFSMAPSE